MSNVLLNEERNSGIEFSSSGQKCLTNLCGIYKNDGSCKFNKNGYCVTDLEPKSIEDIKFYKDADYHE